ncbi:LOW QUALITY PROTEIN: nuclear pore complex protein NUP35-like [Lolium rigidum]|uniref:LOW QUALITY PROTEIN: nuclear pore complex protein NUP35-like n=1 Tax=Lolium rigidum TaxID=89674 RepID=UPI001F5D17D6|nr:LOW QUALITY PROTEIN: nuclear pore complex protein NUP35-like [Lolium rigidum]
MSATRPDHRRHQSPFLRDLSSPVSSSFRMPPASVRREAQASTPPPPPPLLSLDDLSRHSPSPPPYTPPQAAGSPSPPPTRGGIFSTPLRSNGSPAPAAWWSASREEKARDGSPVDGVVHQQQSPPTPSGQQQQQQQQLQVALITLPPPREVARPEMPRDSVLSTGRVDEEEWVTVFGFLPGDTNLVLREFEKCGIVLRHVLGPRNANWMHILYQSRRDAQKALAKHGQQLNSVLIIGVKQVDPWQRQYLNDSTNENYQGSASVGFPSQPVAPSGFATRNALAPLPSNAMQNGGCNESSRSASGAIASPAKSALSKVMDLMFGL